MGCGRSGAGGGEHQPRKPNDRCGLFVNLRDPPKKNMSPAFLLGELEISLEKGALKTKLKKVHVLFCAGRRQGHFGRCSGCWQGGHVGLPWQGPVCVPYSLTTENKSKSGSAPPGFLDTYSL